MDINQGFGSGQMPPAPSEQGQAQEPQLDPNYQITLDAAGQPVHIETPAAPPATPAAEAPAEPTTVSVEDFRKFQATQDRRVAAAERAAADAYRQLQELQSQAAQTAEERELERRLAEAPTAAERERIRLAHQQQQLEQQQQSIAERQWVETQAENLRGWDQEYATTVGLSDLAIQAMSQVAVQAANEELRTGELPREQYYTRIHTLREQAVRSMLLAAARGEAPPGAFRNQPNQQQQAAPPPAPQAPPQQQYQQTPQQPQAGAVPYQPVARPAFAPSNVPAGDALLGQWGRTHDPNDYERLKQHYNLP